MSPEEKEISRLKKQVIRDYIKEYLDKLTLALPTLSPVLIRKARKGDLGAIKEINDRVMGKAKESVKVEGEMPFTIVQIGKINGTSNQAG
jgi:hypothetical protein